jgi:hypothetical protein
MSARKLSRLAGLVFVLIAFIGGGSAYAHGAEHGTGDSNVVQNAEVGSEFGSSSAAAIRTFGVDWT